MPCNTIQTASVDMSVGNPTILRDAVKGLGATQDLTQRETFIAFQGKAIGVRYQAGKLYVSGTGKVAEVTNLVRRAYSKQVLTNQAKQFGWRLVDQGNNKFVMQK